MVGAGIVLSVLLLTAACSGGAGGDDDGDQSFTYAAVGASETVGVGATRPEHDAWPQVLRRAVLDADTTFVNVGVSGSTVRQALEQQLPRAVAAGPDLVTVWLNVNDIVRSVPVAAYERDLAALVSGLRRDGETEVLLANTPPLEDLPVVRACLPNPPPGRRCLLPVSLPGPEPVIAFVQQFNDAIARVADAHGAVLVDLHAVAVAERERRLEHYFSGDGFHPSTEGHAAVARTFAAAWRARRR